MNRHNKRALILGGTNDHIRLIELLRNQGYYTILIDYYESPPARGSADKHIQASTLDKELVLSIATEERVGLVATACTDQALLTMAYVCQELHLPTHLTHMEALALTNKVHMKRVLTDNGIPTSKWHIVATDQPDDYSNWTWPLVAKPADANSSKGVRKVTCLHDLQDAIAEARAVSRTRKVIVEEFRDGIEYSVDAVVNNGIPQIVMISRNVVMQCKQSGFPIIESIYTKSDHQKLQHVVQPVLDSICCAFGIRTGPLLIQMIVERGTAFVLELSARIGGGSKLHLIQKATGFDILDYFVGLLCGYGPMMKTFVSSRVETASMNYIYTYPGVFGALHGADELVREGVIERYFLYKATGAQILGHQSSTDRPAGFMVVAEDVADLRTKVARADARLEIANSNGTDIMIHGRYCKW